MAKRKSSAEAFAFHKQEAERHARRAWIESHPEIKEALALADKLDKLAANEALSLAVTSALVDAAHDIDEKCEHVILAGLAGPVGGETK